MYFTQMNAVFKNSDVKDYFIGTTMFSNRFVSSTLLL